MGTYFLPDDLSPQEQSPVFLHASLLVATVTLHRVVTWTINPKQNLFRNVQNILSATCISVTFIQW